MRARQMARSGILVLSLLLSMVACSGGTPRITPGPVVGPADSGTTTTPPSAQAVPKAAPRWEQVADLSGLNSTETAPFTIAPGAIQWRVRWRCDPGGPLSMTPEPALKKPRALVSGGCRGSGEAFAIETGERRLKVEASGFWAAIVDQQVDTPVNEAPLPEMASAPVLLSGEFYDIERTGKGTAKLYQLPGGRRALRFDGFEVSANTELYVWLSEAPSPRTSADAVAVPHLQLSGLTSTLGPQNYIVPPEVSLSKVRSIVIWCEPVRIAYSAAALQG